MVREGGTPALISEPKSLGPGSGQGDPVLYISMIHIFERKPLKVSGFCLDNIATSGSF